MTDKTTKILVVDDEIAIGRVLKAGLEMHGFAVRYETVSTNTIKACLEFHPDLVLLDIDMPGKDGGSVASELQCHPRLRNTPVIFLTSLVSKEEAAKREASFETLLSKPISISALVVSIREKLQNKETDISLVGRQ